MRIAEALVTCLVLAAMCAVSVVAYSDTADTYEGVCAGKRFAVSAGELWRDNESVGRSGHMGHALVDCGNGRILDFTSNCAGKERCNGHSGYGWMEYRISDDYGKTFGPARVLPCSKKMFDEGRHTALCEKAVRAPDGRIVLFFQITDPSQPICCEPWFEPLMAVSTDNGETFSDFLPTGADRGRIYDAVCDDRYIYFLMPANPHFAGTRPEHVYKVYRAGPDLKFTPFVLPLDAQGRGYGALEFAKDGTLHAYAYNTKCETEMDYTLSRDRGETWSKPGRSHVAIKIRNPQVRRLDDVWFLIGRNGASPSDALAFYTSLDGVNWDAGVKLDVKPAGTGTGYYSCMLPIHEPGRPPRMLMQYSRPYRGSCVNVMHRVITLGGAPPAARTVAEWPLGCDEKGRPDGRCAVSSANDLLVGDVTHVGKLDDGRTALMAAGGAEASDFAFSDTVGRYVTPTNDFTVEGWYNFARLPQKGETWMVVSAFGGDNRWFLTLRRDSIHKGLTWQIFSGTPNTGNALLTTVTDPNTLTNGWHRFALTFAHRTAAGEAEWRFYLDGAPSGRRAVKAFEGTFNGGTRFALGGRGRCGNVIAGSLSCCRLSDRVLSPDEFLKPDKVHVGTPCWKALPSQSVPDVPDGGRTLYNGIVLPQEWPPRIDPKDQNPIKAPYLEADNIPKVIPIDVGRQLFVDDFLIESTNGIVRAFGKPVKYEGNPVMWRQTKAEMSAQAPGCAMSGGGVWWDPTRRKFRMWYMSGFAGRISYAESPDGVHWERPNVGPNGDNVVLPNQVSDTFSVFPGYDTDAPYANWRICISPGGNPTRSAEYVSSDGVRWRFLRRTGQHGDCTTMFHNPFLGKWIWSLRASWRHRSRIYHSHRDFYDGADWHFPLGHGHAQTNTVDCALWLACDNQDLPRTMGDGKTYTNSQLYNVDAVPYESIMVSLFKILCGYENDIAARAGMPKTTSIHFAYSRDGFHFTRPDRTPAIDESGWGSGAWDSGYVGNISSCFAIKDERLWFYYVGARGDGTKNDPPRCTYPNGMHWNFSVGVATLRRDGFAGMVADGHGELVTRPVKFSGAHLFVNADARFGEVAAEVLDEKGEPYPGYSVADCKALVMADSTKHAITWTGGDLSRFAGRPVRFRFKMKVATLFSFWVSKKPTGESGGYVAAGGPDYNGLKDE